MSIDRGEQLKGKKNVISDITLLHKTSLIFTNNRRKKISYLEGYHFDKDFVDKIAKIDRSKSAKTEGFSTFSNEYNSSTVKNCK